MCGVYHCHSSPPLTLVARSLLEGWTRVSGDTLVALLRVVTNQLDGGLN